MRFEGFSVETHQVLGVLEQQKVWLPGEVNARKGKCGVTREKCGLTVFHERKVTRRCAPGTNSQKT
jgi:hypothetical protein